MSQLQTDSEGPVKRAVRPQPRANLSFRGFVVGDIVRVEYPQTDNLRDVDGLAGYRFQEGIVIGHSMYEGREVWWHVSFVGRSYQFFNEEIGLVLPSPLLPRLPLDAVLPALLPPGKTAQRMYEALSAGGWEEFWRCRRKRRPTRKRIPPNI